MKRKNVHIVGTGTIGEPLIGLLCDYRDQLGQNGRSSLQTMFNWNTQSIILIDVINSL